MITLITALMLSHPYPVPPFDPFSILEPSPPETPCVYLSGADQWLCPPGVEAPK